MKREHIKGGSRTRESSRGDVVGRILLPPDIDQFKLDLMYDDYAYNLKVDIHDLDRVIIEHSELYHKVSLYATALLDLKDTEKEKLAKMDSDIASELREGYTEDGVKFTNQSILQDVLRDERHLSISKQYSYIKSQVSRWYALRDSYEQRARMISHLVKLYVSNYFTDSSVKGNEPEPEPRGRVGGSRLRNRDRKNV